MHIYNDYFSINNKMSPVNKRHDVVLVKSFGLCFL